MKAIVIRTGAPNRGSLSATFATLSDYAAAHADLLWHAMREARQVAGKRQWVP